MMEITNNIPYLQEWLKYINEGGATVMVPLTLCVIFLWYGLGYRFYNLKRGSGKSVRDLVELQRMTPGYQPTGLVDKAVAFALKVESTHAKNIRDILTDEFYDIQAILSKNQRLVQMVVIIAPLAGLLGTVSGMIEMFDSLGDQALYSQSGGVASGISKALFTTELGLAIAIPGYILGQMLDKKQSRIEMDLDHIKDLFCTFKD